MRRKNEESRIGLGTEKCGVPTRIGIRKGPVRRNARTASNRNSRSGGPPHSAGEKLPHFQEKLGLRFRNTRGEAAVCSGNFVPVEFRNAELCNYARR